jgi:hypothetical protein
MTITVFELRFQILTDIGIQAQCTPVHRTLIQSRVLLDQYGPKLILTDKFSV